MRSRFSSGSHVPTWRWRGRWGRVWGLWLKQRGDGVQLFIGENWVTTCSARTRGSFYLQPWIWFESSRILELVSTASTSRGNFPYFDFWRREEGDQGTGLGHGRDLGQNEVGQSELEQAARGNRNWANPAAVGLRVGNIRKEKEKGKGGSLED
jgi:hypothetical protein